MLLVPCGDDPDDVQEGGLVSQILVFVRHTHMIGLLVLLVMASSVTCFTVAVCSKTASCSVLIDCLFCTGRVLDAYETDG